MRIITTFLMMCILTLTSNAQITIFYEDFGNQPFYRGPANNYNDFSSGKSFFSADSMAFHNWGTEVSDYSGASGKSFALCGLLDNKYMLNVLQIGPVNTSEFTNVELKFGAATWYGIAADYMDMFYSTDGESWTQLDDGLLSEGDYGDASWGYVTLSETLPSVAELYIKYEVTNMQQAVRLDDISLVGFSTDENPPTQPGTPQLIFKDYNQVNIDWTASSDENGIDHYEILLNGVVFKSVPSEGAIINYLDPGMTYDISIIAYDPGGNSSVESSSLTVNLDDLPQDFEYSWQKPHAKVLPGGDLEWMPEAFVFDAGTSQRYIDFENGDDSNDGTSPATAWKHHPWDSQASGNSKAETGIHTYIFKRGVVYRGTLKAKESGKPGNPIRLTSDPSWGTGEAAIYGSSLITGGWTQSDETVSPKIPDADKVWYLDISLNDPNVIVETSGEEMKRVRTARTPNYQDAPEDPVAYWPTMNNKSFNSEQNKLWLGDFDKFTQPNLDYYVGGTIWSQEDAIVMCTVWGQEIIDYDPELGRIAVRNENFGGVGSHYYIENTPYLLDTTSEYYYDDNESRLYLRLDGDKDPNTTTLEIARTDRLIEIRDKQHIEISGLGFGFTTHNNVRFGYADVKPAIDIKGVCNNLTIKNNSFYYLNGGIAVEGTSSVEQRTRDIVISDNDFHVIDDLAMVIAGRSGIYLENVNILRNRIFDNGGRQRGRWYTSVPAIWGQLISGEIAGNIVDFSWGNGLNFFWGKGGGDNNDIPFIRGIYHHNKASNTLLGTNDYGGIESWQGGPVFIYNNISHNASGYKHYNNTSIGEAFYFDGAFKHIIFNNIASGVSPERNNTAFMTVLGYYNLYIHNTGYNTSNLFSSGSNNLRSNGYNAFLSNIGDNVNNFLRHSIYEDYVPYDAYAYNVSSGNEFTGSITDKNSTFNLEEFIAALEEYQPRRKQTGWNAAAPVLENPAESDFRPRVDGEAIDRGVKFFSPFPLSKVVGEWSFHKQPGDSSVIMSENFYMTETFSDRITYHEIDKNHLQVHNLTDSTYQYGILEDWVQGVVSFNGQNTYCSLNHADASQLKSNDVDMTDNNFIIEAVFRADKEHTGGVMVSKTNNINGYELGIDNTGHVYISILTSGVETKMSSDIPVNDSSWHHLLAEVHRGGQIRLFINGEPAEGTLSGTFPDRSQSLSTTADLLIGKDVDDNFFSGSIDFLRISKATLAEARTTINELYTWFTDGPFNYDFTGNEPLGKRDAGAIESGIKNCDLEVEKTLVEFGTEAAFETIQVYPIGQDIAIYEHIGDFYNWSLSATNELRLTSLDNTNFDQKEGKVVLFACNESIEITVRQAGAPCRLESEVDTVRFDYHEGSIKFKVDHNDVLIANRNASFFQAEVVPTGDSVVVSVRENTLGPERESKITLEACDETLEVVLIQSGDPNSVNTRLPEGMQVYPNPVKDNLLNVQMPAKTESFSLVISDLSGQVFISRELHGNTHQLDLNLKPGIYHLHISNQEYNVKTPLMILE